MTEPGLPCPTCGCLTHEVLDTRPRIGRVFRRRKCERGHQFTTTETVVGPVAPRKPSAPPKVSATSAVWPRELTHAIP